MVVTHDPEVGEVSQRTVVLEYSKITKEIHNDSFGQLFSNRGTRKERFIMKKKLIAMFCILTLALLTLAGCSGSASYTDGTYEGKSEFFKAHILVDRFSKQSFLISPSDIQGTIQMQMQINFSCCHYFNP